MATNKVRVPTKARGLPRADRDASLRAAPQGEACGFARFQVIPATAAHAAAIDLRPADRAEIEALGFEPREGVRRSLERALWADTYLVEGEIAAIVGLGLPSMLGRAAVPWLVTGTPVDHHRKAFLRLTRARIERMRRGWDLLVNHVHADYAQAVRWLAWLGFEIAPARPFGPRGALFHQATMRGLP